MVDPHNLSRRLDLLSERVDSHDRKLSDMQSRMGGLDQMQTQVVRIGEHVRSMAERGAEERGRLTTAVETMRGELTKVEGRMGQQLTDMRSDFKDDLRPLVEAVAGFGKLEGRLASVEPTVNNINRLIWALMTAFAVYVLVVVLYTAAEFHLSPEGLSVHEDVTVHEAPEEQGP